MCTRKQPGASGIRTPLISIRFQCTTRSPRSPFKDFLSYGAVFVAFSGKEFPTDLTTIRFLCYEHTEMRQDIVLSFALL